MIEIYNENIEKICNLHWEYCKEKNKPELESFLRNYNHPKNKNEEKFKELLELFLQDNNLQKIITSKPKKLIEFYGNNLASYNDVINFQPKGKPFTKELNKIFGYSKFASKTNCDKNWNAYLLAEKLGVDVCPYCNRAYTITVSKKTKKIVRPDFDHFFPKAKYPYFQMSFYNLIPSCTICNSRLKLTEFDIYAKFIHPYLDGFGSNAKFTYEITDVKYLNSSINETKNSIRIKFKFKEQNNEEIKCNITVFKLDEIYQFHRDIVAETIHIAELHPQEYLDSIVRFKGLGYTKNDIYRLIFRNYYEPQNFQKRPLSKLTRDIYDEIVGKHHE
jgi:hypothetical protein